MSDDRGKIEVNNLYVHLSFVYGYVGIIIVGHGNDIIARTYISMDDASSEEQLLCGEHSFMNDRPQLRLQSGGIDVDHTVAIQTFHDNETHRSRVRTLFGMRRP